MKMAAINEKFTEMVNHYLAQGYIINPITMRGHQGEVCKVDVLNTKTKTLIRLWMNEEYDYDWENDNHFHGKKVVVRASIFIKKYEGQDTIWERDLQTIEEYTYYAVNRCADWYVDSLEEALEIQELQHQRWRKNRTHFEKDSVYHDEAHQLIAVKYLKRKIGYKRVSMEHASITKKVHKGKTTYYVHYRQDSYLVR